MLLNQRYRKAKKKYEVRSTKCETIEAISMEKNPLTRIRSIAENFYNLHYKLIPQVVPEEGHHHA